MSIWIIQTEDGSHSIYNAELKETYHSSNGALTESRHVFLKNGLEFYADNFSTAGIKLFEVGFGTGLNALLAWQWAEEKQIPIIYHSIEQFPLVQDLVKEINYGKILNEQEKLERLHAASWNDEQELSSVFKIKKINKCWPEYKMEESYSIIFYDAFAPSKQPEMWEMPLLEKCYNALNLPGILTTYCARGQFKRDLIALGFEVETLPGPPGKKEMVRGVKNEKV